MWKPVRAHSAPGSSGPGSSGPGSSGPGRALRSRVAEVNYPVPAGSRTTQLPPVNNQCVPDELLVSLTSTLCNRSTPGHTAHHRHCRGCGFRRPDAVWHHPLGRNKYKYFLEQPTSLTGAGRDISFLCDSKVTQRKSTPLPPLTDTQDLSVSESLIPEEYHIVKNKGLQTLKFYEDAFTVQLQDDEQKLRVFPSLRPSGRMEAIKLMMMMDNMLLKAGVDQPSEELTEISQMEGLLEMVQMEQNIYNIVFHEVIRQVAVNCAERGQLLAKLRQRYQSMLERIPRCLKALHTEALAQRTLNCRFTEEICRIKASIQQLSRELSRFRDHEDFVSEQAERAHQQLSGELEQAHTNSKVVQGYHELYELQRGRLEAQLLRVTEERDQWSQLTLLLALKLIGVKKLQPIHQLHISGQHWFQTAEHCSLSLSSKDTEDLNIVMEFADQWKEQLTAFPSQLRETERAQYDQLSAIHKGIAKWLDICTTQNKCPDSKDEEASLRKLHTDLRQWSNMLALQCEHYEGEKLLCCQQKLNELERIQKRWLNASLQLFRRHPCPDGKPPGGQRDLGELDKVLSGLLERLDAQVSGENGFHRQTTSLLRLMECWVSELGGPGMVTISDWLKLEKALHSWQSLVEKATQNVCFMQTDEYTKDKNKPDIYSETEKVLEKVQQFITRLSTFTDGENQRLSEELTSLHAAQTRWMLNLLFLVVPDCSDEQNQEHLYITNISPKTLDEDAKMLTMKLENLSKYIISSCKLILEEKIQQHQHEAESENELNECRRLQAECTDWADTCAILLSGVKRDPVDLPVRLASDVPVSAGSMEMEALENDEILAEPIAENKVKGEPEAEPRKGALTLCESTVVKVIGYDGNITQRKLGESCLHLNGTEELLVSPVTEAAQRAFSDLATVVLLQQQLHDSELQVQSAEQRALKGEEALQAALEKIQDLEGQLQGQSNQGSRSE